MTVKYGLYEPDGKHYSGELNRYHDRAVLLAAGRVGFYFESDRDRIILGSAIDVQKKGKRQDLHIYFMECQIESFQVSVIRDFYLNAVASLRDAGYEVLNIWGDERFVSSLDTLTLGYSGQSGPVLSYLSGKIVAQKPSYAFTKDFKRAMSLVSGVLEVMQPILFLGYRCAVGRDAIDRENPPDLSVLPMKPYNQHAANLDSGQIDDTDASTYQRFGKVLIDNRSSLFGKEQRIGTKQKLLNAIEDTIRRGLTPSKRLDHYSRLDELNIPRTSSNTIEDAVTAVIEKNNTAYLERYLSGNFNQRDFQKYVYELPALQFLDFFTKAKETLLKMKTADGKKISNNLSNHARQLQTVANQLKEKHDPEIAPRKPDKDSLMDEKSNRRGGFAGEFNLKKILLIGGIIGLIIAIGVAVTMFAPGIFGGDGPTDGTVPGLKSEAGPEEPITVPSDDGRVRLIYSNDSVSINGAGPLKIVHTEGVPKIGNGEWFNYDDSYYTIEPDVRFDPPAELIFTVDDRNPDQIYIGHKSCSALNWTREDPSIDGQDLTLTIHESGMYALFLENVTDAPSGGV
ncbi:hypothetical protein [Methanofollis fontis]|uniref:Uncharacterized protein n=1 Tax=Methanofollis fontis TaxID=2052832 RepID=A0A483CW60_9EURY|nr:hypothetical protein [Methanofollis fontis]TAJ45797.1 hypothetical protein CUJ86_03560 [Methanofollis fontis]